MGEERFFQEGCHPGYTCEEYVQQRKKDVGESEQAIKDNGVKCPECRSPIYKELDCYHMGCRNSNCGHHFCWICKVDMDFPARYARDRREWSTDFSKSRKHYRGHYGFEYLISMTPIMGVNVKKLEKRGKSQLYVPHAFRKKFMVWVKS